MPSCGNEERAVGVLCTRMGILRTTFPKRPLCSKKCFPAYFIKYTEYRPKILTGRAWLYPESAADLHLVISQTCWLQMVPILRGGRLRQVPLKSTIVIGMVSGQRVNRSTQVSTFKPVGVRQRSEYIDMYVVKSLGRLGELALN